MKKYNREISYACFYNFSDHVYGNLQSSDQSQGRTEQQM